MGSVNISPIGGMMQAAVVSEQGRRRFMEDAYFLDMDFAGKGWVFGGVYDGHSGYEAADYAARHLHQRFLDRLEKGEDPRAAFERAYEAISAELAHQPSGTTAVAFLLRGSELTVSNVGDSRALLVGRHRVVQLTEDHRLDNPDERERVIQMGAEIDYPYVMRGLNGLMPTRSLGDPHFEDVGIISMPFIAQCRVHEREDICLLVACDGLFDVMSNEEAADMARKHPDADELVHVLKQEALDVRRGMDNLTLLALALTSESE
ncbi:MAG: PP2C family protein-serine/threonine phosphatase [Deltaproteobacteria bacterium]|nr:PP2C family protein-serine/threonine phosphatase [Deltaproteobacteria bacterium]